MHCHFSIGHTHQLENVIVPKHSFGFRIRVFETMSEPLASGCESNSNAESSTPKTNIEPSDVQESFPRRNRWHRSRCSQRPPGKDHSLGFPLRERGGDGESSSSEVILFRTPIIEVEPPSGSMAPSSSSALPAISESMVSGSYSPKESSTPKFGANSDMEDPWSTKDETVPVDVNPNNPGTAQSSRAIRIDYGELIWKCLREGDDPWYTD